MDPLAAQLDARYQAGLAFVPEICRRHYRVMWCDARLQLYAYPAQQTAILRWLDDQTSLLLDPRRVQFLPPLYWPPGLSEADYLERCYAADDGPWRAALSRHVQFVPIAFVHPFPKEEPAHA